jgi:hypothetical protein
VIDLTGTRMRYFIEASVPPETAFLVITKDGDLWHRIKEVPAGLRFCEGCREHSAWGWVRGFDGKTLCNRCLNAAEE